MAWRPANDHVFAANGSAGSLELQLEHGQTVLRIVWLEEGGIACLQSKLYHSWKKTYVCMVMGHAVADVGTSGPGLLVMGEVELYGWQ